MRILITGGTNGMGKGVAKVLASINDQKHEIWTEPLCVDSKLSYAI